MATGAQPLESTQHPQDAAKANDAAAEAKQKFASEALDKRKLVVQPSEGYYQTLKRVIPELKDEEASKVASETKSAMHRKNPLIVGDVLPIVDRATLEQAIARSYVPKDTTTAAATPAPIDTAAPAKGEAKVAATPGADAKVTATPGDDTKNTAMPAVDAKAATTPGADTKTGATKAPDAGAFPVLDAPQPTDTAKAGTTQTPATETYPTPKPADSGAKETEKAQLTGIAGTAHWLGQKAEDVADTAGRIAYVTKNGLFSKEILNGVGNALSYDWNHKAETAKMLVESVVFGAGMKAVMAEKSPVAAVGGLTIGTVMLAKSLSPLKEAYSNAIYAKNDHELDMASKQLSDAAGGFLVDTGISMLGYKAGAGTMGRVMEGESFDRFADGKQAVWDKVDGTVKGAGNSIKSLFIATDPGIGVAPEVQGPMTARIVGDRAHLIETSRSAPTRGTLVGDVKPDETVQVTLLAQTKGSKLLMDRYINRINKGAAALTDQQIIDKFGTVDASGKAIEQFAADHGLTIKDVNHASGRYFVEGSTQQMEKAFGVNWKQYEHDGVQFRGRVGTLSVTPDLAPHIKGILGLDNRPQFHTNYVRLSDFASGAAATQTESTGSAAIDAISKLSGKKAVGDVTTEATEADADAKAKPKGPAGYRPLTVAENMKAMNVPETRPDGTPMDGRGMVTGFLSLGGTMGKPWLKYMVDNSIDPKTFEERNVGSRPPVSDPKGANGENQLDGVIHKMANPKGTTVMVQAPNTDSGMPDGIDRITFPKQGESQITHASVSWGQYEDGWTDQSRQAMEDAGKRAALKKITITVAAGDNGAGDGSPSHIQQVDIPAGLEYYTAVGGTLLKVDQSGNYIGEKAWSGMGATGGGRSMFTPRPVWQKLLNIPANLNGSKFDGRAVPDIAGNAHPSSGLLTPTDFGIQAIGGTSEAAPLTVMGASKVTESTGIQTGYWNPTLYKLKANSFNDVTEGNNTDEGVKGYPSTVGYDLNTGRGSLNVGNMIDNYNTAANTPKWVTISKAAGAGVFKGTGTKIPGYLIPGYLQNSQEMDDQKKAGAYK